MTVRIVCYRPKVGSDLAIRVLKDGANCSRAVALALYEAGAVLVGSSGGTEETVFTPNLVYEYPSGLVYRLYDDGLREGTECIEFLGDSGEAGNAVLHQIPELLKAAEIDESALTAFTKYLDEQFPVSNRETRPLGTGSLAAIDPQPASALSNEKNDVLYQELAGERSKTKSLGEQFPVSNQETRPLKTGSLAAIDPQPASSHSNEKNDVLYQELAGERSNTDRRTDRSVLALILVFGIAGIGAAAGAGIGHVGWGYFVEGPIKIIGLGIILGIFFALLSLDIKGAFLLGFLVAGWWVLTGDWEPGYGTTPCAGLGGLVGLMLGGIIGGVIASLVLREKTQ